MQAPCRVICPCPPCGSLHAPRPLIGAMQLVRSPRVWTRSTGCASRRHGRRPTCLGLEEHRVREPKTRSFDSGNHMADTRSSRNQQARSPRDPWHAVSVVASPTACAAVTALRGKRVLSDHAPRLPLADCTRPLNCACTYRHYPDRRGAPRRATERGMAARAVLQERRREPGRRADDR